MRQGRNLQTGQYIAGCRTHGKYVRVECTERQWRVFVGVPTMTQSELDRFQSGEIRLTAALIDESLFFLFRFGDAPWAAAPIAPNVCDAALTPEDGKMSFVFVDSDSGVAQEIRSAGLDAEASAFLSRTCEEALSFACDRAERLKRQAAVLRQYPTGEAMLQAADPAPVFLICK